ncbi:M50 family metallopeptidase [Microbacterium indicum]|uniref:M50 family metallopeptidase n=1 Tax=Microbacterium indicum TaxID=358100 RepID=UPI0004002516|nr:M50 family metallopeptidase [Microbacterium indicum]
MAVIAFIVGVLVMLVGLGISIALHEMGHILPAKAFGVRVGQYMIGFGPTLWSRRMGETEYGFKALPLGGFISISGMYPPSPEAEGIRKRVWSTLVQEARAANDESIGDAGDRVLYKQATWKRLVVMLGGPFMNLVLAAVLFSILYSGIGMYTSTTTVGTVSQCVLPADTDQTECASGDTPSPAAAAGLEPGDVIVAVDGTDVATFDEASAIIRVHAGDTIPLTVERDGSDVTLQITPVLAENQYTDENGDTVTGQVGFVGFSPTTEREAQPIWAGIQATGQQVGNVVDVIVHLPQRIYETAVDLFTGQARDPDGPIGVVGVGRIAGEVAAADAPIMDRVATIVNLLASLNVALMVFNLIPLLPLDGGHVVVALWDGIKRMWFRIRRKGTPKPADATRLVPLTLVVVTLMIGMSVLLLAADLFNPVDLFGTG